MPLVNLPDGTQADFPDDMSNEQIETVIKQHLGSNTSEDTSEQSVSQSQPTDNTAILNAPLNKQVQDSVDKVNALGGGIASGMNDIAWATQSAINWGIGKFNKKLGDKLQQGADELHGEMQPSNSATIEGMQKNPVHAAVGKYGTNIAAGVATGGAAAVTGSKLLNAVGTTLTNGLVGAGASGGTDQGFMLGAGISAAGSTLGAGFNKAVTALTKSSSHDEMLKALNNIKQLKDVTAADKEALEGAKKVLLYAKNKSSAADQLLLPFIGGAVGYHQDNSLEGVAKGALAFYVLPKLVGGMINSSTGQAILRQIGKSSEGKALVGQMLKTMATEAAATNLKKDPQSPQE